MKQKLRTQSAGESVTLLGVWKVGLLSLESCCGRSKMRNSVSEGLRQEIGWHAVGYVSYSIFKVSDERNPERRMIREVEYHQHRVVGLLMN